MALETPHLDARQVAAQRLVWKPISRLEALRLCHHRRVVIVRQGLTGETAEEFGPKHLHYRVSAAYPLAGLRYFVFLGSVTERAKPSNGLAGEKTPGQFDPFEASNYTPLDEPEETRLYPITFELLSPSGKPLPPTPYEITLPDGSKRTGTSGADGFIRYEYNRTPGQATLKLLPGQAVKQLAPEKPLGSDPEKFPISIQLTNGRGEPLPDFPYTLVLANGKRLEGRSGADGLISHPDNLVPGDVKLRMREEAAVEAPPADLPGPETPSASGLAAHAHDSAAKSLKPIEIRLVDAKGKPLAHRGYRMTLPDGTPVRGTSDAEGFIRLPENTQDGEVDFALTEEGEAT